MPHDKSSRDLRTQQAQRVHAEGAPDIAIYFADAPIAHGVSTLPSYRIAHLVR